MPDVEVSTRAMDARREAYLLRSWGGESRDVSMPVIPSFWARYQRQASSIFQVSLTMLKKGGEEFCSVCVKKWTFEKMSQSWVVLFGGENLNGSTARP